SASLLHRLLIADAHAITRFAGVAASLNLYHMTRTRRASMVFAVCAWFVTASQERVADFQWVAAAIDGQRCSSRRGEHRRWATYCAKAFPGATEQLTFETDAGPMAR